ncbi:MAG: alpha/beta fold hydrolase [Chloroflexi bacterium]|nr:alpha/beta fold hydrolase [Chloroflexota bacterium]
MDSRKHIFAVLVSLLATLVACNAPGVVGMAALPSTPPTGLRADELASANHTNPIEPPEPTAQAASANSSVQLTPTATEVVFEVGKEITIPYLRSLEISGSPITFEQELTPTFYYQQHLVSYISEGNKIFGLLTIPNTEPPDSGFKAIVFNHGYNPPDTYQTTERYAAYVDYLARNGFVCFKIDFRGHGQSEGQPTGSYFSPGYTIDAIAALKSLQTLDIVDPQGIGMWGHSMAGNLVLRAMLIEPDIQAGVIFGGAVYSYDDFATYGIDDNTYRPPTTQDESDPPRRSQEIFEVYGRPDTATGYWQAVSLTENISFLDRPLQLHHAQDDPVVNIRYSEDLAAVLLRNGKEYEFYVYEGGGHNFFSPYFDRAMQRTVEFFQDHL